MPSQVKQARNQEECGKAEYQTLGNTFLAGVQIGTVVKRIQRLVVKPYGSIGLGTAGNILVYLGPVMNTGRISTENTDNVIMIVAEATIAGVKLARMLRDENNVDAVVAMLGEVLVSRKGHSWRLRAEVLLRFINNNHGAGRLLTQVLDGDEQGFIVNIKIDETDIRLNMGRFALSNKTQSIETLT